MVIGYIVAKVVGGLVHRVTQRAGGIARARAEADDAKQRMADDNGGGVDQTHVERPRVTRVAGGASTDGA